MKTWYLDIDVAVIFLRKNNCDMDLAKKYCNMHVPNIVHLPNINHIGDFIANVEIIDAHHYILSPNPCCPRFCYQ